jgi:hypothetical protein
MMLNPRLADLQKTLRESLSVNRVDELEEFPFNDYSEFIAAQNEGRVEVLTGDDPKLFGTLAGPGATWAYRFMGWSAFLVAGACVLGWWQFRNASLLVGVPLACIGAVLSDRAFMRSVGLWLNRGLLGVGFYLLYQGTSTGALLVASYLVPNYLYHWRRHLARRIFLRAAAESELILVWLFSRGQLVPVADSPASVRAGKRPSDTALQPAAARVSVERQPFQERPVTNVHSKTPLTLVVGQSSPARPQRNDHRDDRRSDAGEHRDLHPGDPTEFVRSLGAEGGKLGLWRQSEATGDVRPKTRGSVLRDVGAISATH